MTTARSSRNRLIVSCAMALAVAGGARASAHRLDEYLQAARIGIEPTRVTIELDLTPGMAVASKLIAEIDGDRDGAISKSEMHLYAARVLADLHADIDEHALALQLTDTQPPPIDALRHGDGPIRLEMTAAFTALGAGEHRLRFRNNHHTDLGVYLANALVPETNRVFVVDQSRDVDQREVTIQFVVNERPAGGWLPLGLSLSLTALAGLWWRRRWSADPMVR